MPISLEQLNQQYSADGRVHFDRGEGGLIRATLRHDYGEVQVYPHGAHVTRYQPADGRDVLFLSKRSHFAPGQPIRGGIPICFPWFSGTHDPAHGFARLREWDVESAAREGHSVTLTLRLETSPDWSEHWPHRARLRYVVRLADRLELTLSVTNLDNVPITFEEALHTYLAVGDIQRVRVHGLGGCAYIDKMLDGREVVQESEPLILQGETDRIYADDADDGAACQVEDGAWNRRIELRKKRSQSTVVWNPWHKRAGELTDLGEDQWTGMLCVETANVKASAITLTPGRTHDMSVAIQVVS